MTMEDGTSFCATFAAVYKKPYGEDKFNHAEYWRRARSLGSRPPWYRPFARRRHDADLRLIQRDEWMKEYPGMQYKEW